MKLQKLPVFHNALPIWSLGLHWVLRPAETHTHLIVGCDNTNNKQMRASWSVAAVAAAVATAALARPALAAAAATSSAPCYTAINGAVGLDSVTTIETPCATTLFDFTDNSGGRLVLRAYPPAAAYVVECRIKDDPGNSFSDNLFFTAR